MRVRPLEVVLTLFIVVALALSVRDATVAEVRRARITPAAAALEALVSARTSQNEASSYRAANAGRDGARAIERPLISLGAGYLRGGQVREAIAVFQMTVEAVPRSWTAWHALGAAYESAGDRPRAAAAYAASVALNPGNDKGREALARVQGG